MLVLTHFSFFSSIFLHLYVLFWSLCFSALFLELSDLHVGSVKSFASAFILDIRNTSQMHICRRAVVLANCASLFSSSPHLTSLYLSPERCVSFLEVTFRAWRKRRERPCRLRAIYKCKCSSSIIYPLSIPFCSSLSPSFSAFGFFSASVGKPLHRFHLFLSLFFSNTILLNTCRYPPCSLNVAILQSHFQLCFNELCY